MSREQNEIAMAAQRLIDGADFRLVMLAIKQDVFAEWATTKPSEGEALKEAHTTMMGLNKINDRMRAYINGSKIELHNSDQAGA